MSAQRYTVEQMTGLEVYKIGNEAIIILQPSTGYVSVACPYHAELNGCHWWNARGSDSLHEFLIGLDRDYAMGKLFNRRALEEFDDDRSKKEIKKWIIDCRREGSITAEAVHDIWDELEACESASDVAKLSDIDVPYDFIYMKPKGCANWFWNDVWSSFIAHLSTPVVIAQN